MYASGGYMVRHGSARVHVQGQARTRIYPDSARTRIYPDSAISSQNYVITSMARSDEAWLGLMKHGSD